MKKIVIILMSLIFTLSLIGCGSEQKENDIEESVNIEELKTKYSEYFQMSDFKGIEVYVWQMNENVYKCGMMGGTNRAKSEEEIWDLQENALTIEEAKAILKEIGVDKKDIIIIPISQPLSSYMYTIDDEYKGKVTKLFD